MKKLLCGKDIPKEFLELLGLPAHTEAFTVTCEGRDHFVKVRAIYSPLLLEQPVTPETPRYSCSFHGCPGNHSSKSFYCSGYAEASR